jgi:hypothetical protein
VLHLQEGGIDLPGVIGIQGFTDDPAIRSRQHSSAGIRISGFNLEEILMRKESIKPFVWGMAVGTVVLLIVIFAAGWVVTSSSAHATAEEIAEKAVVDRLAAICVAQFQQDPDRDERLKELKEADSWKRRSNVEEGGWATMPGDESPDRKVANECARRLMELDQ